VAGATELPPPGATASLDIGGVGPFVIEGLPTRWGTAEQFGVGRIVESPPLEP
jgi:hypothetical protein